MSKHKLLVIDDEPEFAQMLVDYFKRHNCDVSFATNLEDAITLFRKHHPKVVLLDFNMPIVTGEKFLPVLQTLDPLVRVIVVSGCIEAEVEERFKGLGYFAYFEKGSISLEKVREKVEEAFKF